MSVQLLSFWSDLSNNIGFYSHENSYDIPDGPGIYAWYLPLWIYFDDMEEFVSYVQEISFFPGEDSNGELIETRAAVDFNWDSLSLKVRKSPMSPNYEAWNEKWSSMIADPSSRGIFEEAIMKASIFNPPLYIGRADSLASRYQQHILGAGDKNTFNKRFTQHSKRLGRELLVSDLLFVCVPISNKENKILNDRHLTELLEKVMLHTCRPPFSER